METTVDLDKVKDYLLRTLRISGWQNKLKAFIHSSDFDDILAFLAEEVSDARRFTPPVKYLFKAFEKCPFEELKVVLIADGPYPRLGVADGIALSCSLTGRAEPALDCIFDAIEKDLESAINRHPDLGRWGQQGILLLNIALTSRLDASKGHIKLWRPFINYLLDMLNMENRGLIFVFMGTTAADYASLIGDQHYKLIAGHPDESALDHTAWNGNHIFREIDSLVRDNYQTVLSW
jgi:uracil-DNA glycosylase